MSMTGDATFSPCRLYRYVLWRRWAESPRYAMFIGLNPSTADERTDDPTIRRCIRFASDWGYDGLCMTNLFAFRATAPEVMRQAADPIGPQNDDTLFAHAAHAAVVIAAWGVHGQHRGRDTAVRQMLPVLHYLRLTRAGLPGHPLYLPATSLPILWQPGRTP